jgi:hypothetical protein
MFWHSATCRYGASTISPRNKGVFLSPKGSKLSEGRRVKSLVRRAQPPNPVNSLVREKKVREKKRKIPMVNSPHVLK